MSAVNAGAMVVYEPPPDEETVSAENHFQRGDKVSIHHSDPHFNGAIGQVLRFLQHKNKYMVRIPSSKCQSMCARSDECVKACVDSRHKGWCRTDPKKMQPGIGLVMCAPSGLSRASESDYYMPVAVSQDDEEKNNNFGHAPFHPTSASPESGGDSASSASAETAHSTGSSRKRPICDALSSNTMSTALREFLVCELGITEEFAAVSANACIGQAFEGMHFQPYVKRKLS